MTLPIWPLDLPQNAQIGSAEQPKLDIIRTSMEVGPPKQRLRTGKVWRQYGPIKMLLTTEQSETLDAFALSCFQNYGGKFQWTDPRTNTTQNMRWSAFPTYQNIAPGFVDATIALETY